MPQALIQLLLYALLASFSALALAATIAVLGTGRLKALAFGVGFFAGQLFTCALFVLVGVAATRSTEKSHRTVQSVLELLLAVALVGFAIRIRARGPSLRAGSSERARVLYERLRRLRISTMALSGLVLGVGGPKRLLLTVLAAGSITTAGVGDAGEIVLVLWYVGLASAVVWIPVLLFLLLGTRAVALMTRVQALLTRYQRETMVYALLALAVLLTVDALTLT